MTFIHPTAIVETTFLGDNTKIWAYAHICKDAKIGSNCVIGEGVYIGPSVTVGDNCKIQNHSLIYEGVEIENDVFIGPNVITTNDFFPRAIGDWKHRFMKTYIKKGASICANVTLVCGNEIGENSMVGAGSVVTHNVEPNDIVYGNPAISKKELQCPVISILRGMTDGYYVNIDNAYDMGILKSQFNWDGIELTSKDYPLHQTMQSKRCPTILYFVAIRDFIDVSIIKSFLDDEQNFTKRRVIIFRLFHSDEMKKFLTDNYYTFIYRNGMYDYFIHTLWDNLL